MRGVLLSLAFAFLVSAAVPAYVAASSIVRVSPMVVALQAQEPTKSIEINVNDHGGRVWYRNPVWIAIGVIALVVLVLVVALIARGGGPTIIKE